MADRDLEDDLQSFFKNNPLETRLIGGSLLAYFVVFEPLFQWMWDDGTRCGVWGDDYSCMGSVWLTLAYVAILCLVMAPAIWGVFSVFTKYFTRVNDQQRGDVVWLATLGIPLSMIWATIWLYCFPHLWALLPWGSWDTNWWKIFPFIFGLSWLGLGPLIGTISTILGEFKEFAEAEKQAHEFELNFAEELKQSSADTSFEKTSFSRIVTDEESVSKPDQITPQKRYVFVPEDMTWNEHSHRAQVMGGNLASITSAKENEWLTRISDGKPVWIGGIRKGVGNGPGADHWYWSDGQPWTYTNWHPDEPNNLGGGENRVHLGLQAPGTWNDVGEGWRGPAVYQIPEAATTESNPPQFTSILGDMNIHDKYKK